MDHLLLLQFPAIDTHGPLVALCDAHLVAAALHILARVLGGVHGCKGGGGGGELNSKTSTPAQVVFLHVYFCLTQRQDARLPSKAAAALRAV